VEGSATRSETEVGLARVHCASTGAAARRRPQRHGSGAAARGRHAQDRASEAGRRAARTHPQEDAPAEGAQRAGSRAAAQRQALRPDGDVARVVQHAAAGVLEREVEHARRRHGRSKRGAAARRVRWRPPAERRAAARAGARSAGCRASGARPRGVGSTGGDRASDQRRRRTAGVRKCARRARCFDLRPRAHAQPVRRCKPVRPLRARSARRPREQPRRVGDARAHERTLARQPARQLTSIRLTLTS
jgi:hypothetical protein